MFSCDCIKCGAESAVSLDLDDCVTFRCRECNDEFTTDDVRELIANYSRVLAWIGVAEQFANATVKPAVVEVAEVTA